MFYLPFSSNWGGFLFLFELFKILFIFVKINFKNMAKKKDNRGGARPNTGNRYTVKPKKIQISVSIPENLCELNGGKSACTLMVYELIEKYFKNTLN